MSELNEVEKTQVHERYPSGGPLRSIKVSLAGYWARFEKSPDGKVVMRQKGEMCNSRAFNVSIPRDVYQKIHKRAICEFNPEKPKPTIAPSPKVDQPSPENPPPQLDLFKTPTK